MSDIETANIQCRIVGRRLHDSLTANFICCQGVLTARYSKKQVPPDYHKKENTEAEENPFAMLFPSLFHHHFSMTLLLYSVDRKVFGR